MRSSATSRWRASMRLSGSILLALTIAASRPASTASCRNTEFSTTRAAGLSPNEMFETPRIVKQPGSSCLMRRTPAIVSSALRRSSSMPVEIGSASESKKMSSAGMPHFCVACSKARFAISNLPSAVRAIPCSSIVPMTTLAPYFFASSSTLAKRGSPSS